MGLETGSTALRGYTADVSREWSQILNCTGFRSYIGEALLSSVLQVTGLGGVP